MFNNNVIIEMLETSELLPLIAENDIAKIERLIPSRQVILNDLKQQKDKEYCIYLPICQQNGDISYRDLNHIKLYCKASNLIKTNGIHTCNMCYKIMYFQDSQILRIEILEKLITFTKAFESKYNQVDDFILKTQEEFLSEEINTLKCDDETKQNLLNTIIENKSNRIEDFIKLLRVIATSALEQETRVLLLNRLH